MESIQKLLEQRDEIDRQLKELGYVDVAETPVDTEDPAPRGKRLLPADTKLRMSAQYWLRHAAKNPEGYKAAITPVRRDTDKAKKDSPEIVAHKAALRQMIRQLKKKGSNGFSPRNKIMR